MQNPPNISVKPAVYLDVTIRGQKMVYDVATATDLRNQLSQALAALAQPQPSSECSGVPNTADDRPASQAPSDETDR